MMNLFTTRTLLAATTAACLAHTASAATLALFNFENDSLASVDTDAVSTATHFTDQATGNASDFLGSATGGSLIKFAIEDIDGSGVGTTTSNALVLAPQRETEPGYTTASAPPGFTAASTWFEFTITPGSGYILTLDELSLDTSFFSSLTGTTGARFVVSADSGSGFSQIDIVTGTALVGIGDTAYEVLTVDLSSIVLGVDQGVTIRIDPQTTGNNNGNNNQRRITLDNVSVTGTAEVPEPGSLALVALGGLVIVRRRQN